MLYITAYVFLILQIVKPMSIKSVFNRFPAYVLILIVLDIYSIILVSDIAVKSDLLYGTYDYLIEIAYNTVIMTIPSDNGWDSTNITSGRGPKSAANSAVKVKLK